MHFPWPAGGGPGSIHDQYGEETARHHEDDESVEPIPRRTCEEAF